MPPRIARGEDENTPPTYVYDLTYAEVLEHFRETKYFIEGMKLPGITEEKEVRIPTLDEVFEALDRRVIINIEVKTPKTVELRPTYDTNRLIKVLHDNL